jgi:hypothetical protein
LSALRSTFAGRAAHHCCVRIVVVIDAGVDLISGTYRSRSASSVRRPTTNDFRRHDNSCRVRDFVSGLENWCLQASRQMKIEYLAEGAAECPLIRLFSFTPDEAQLLRNAFRSLAAGPLERVFLDHILAVENQNGVSLEFSRVARNAGVVNLGHDTFAVQLSGEGWATAAGLVEPFCERSSVGYQWLTDTGAIRLLLSPTGHW